MRIAFTQSENGLKNIGGLDSEKDWEIVFIGERPDENALASSNAEVLLVSPMTPVTKRILTGSKRLKLIQSTGVGFDKIDLSAARDKGIYVANCAGANAGPVAEQAVLLMLAVLRHFREYEDLVRSANQQEVLARCLKSNIRELSDCHVGLVGMGNIGRETARRLDAFGCRISYYARHEVPGCPYPRLPLDTLYAQCDIVSLHVPLSAETAGMVGEEAFAKMKRGSILINTARGGLVDQEALCRALRDGRLAGAGLDTFEPEPITPDNPILKLPPELLNRVALSPHVAGLTHGALRRCREIFWGNVKRIAKGERPINIVNGL